MAIAITKDQEMAAHWKTQIELCDKELRRFRKRGKNISKKYRDDRGSVSDGDRPDASTKRSLNMFWSNVQVLKPAVYSKCPVPICERRFLDKDTTGRTAATILERALRYEVQMSGFHNAVRRARDDYLIPGRGTIWIRYNPKFGAAISPSIQSSDEIESSGEKEAPAEQKEFAQDQAQEQQLEAETINVDYLHWQDYYTFPAKARTEEEIEGKGRRIFMSRQDLIEKFGEEEGKKVPLDHSPNDDDTGAQSKSQVNNIANQATIFEIWWKPERKVYFVAKEYDKCLIPEGVEADADGDGIPDPLKLDGFFPCPCPLNATLTNDTTIPVPDYVEAEDQYMQIDDLTKRIDILTNACKVRGVYDASAQGVKRVFEEGQEPDLIPVDSWAMFAEKGGLKGAIDWVPLEDIAKTLQILIGVRKEIMADLDLITGINDISRGTSDARETLGGVRLKNNATTGRLQERQDQMATFCRDAIAIMGEIVSELYSPETLIQVSGALYDEGLDPPALAPQAVNQMPLPPQGAMPQQLPLPGMGAPPTPPAPGGMGGPPTVPSMQIPQEPPEQKQQRKLMMLLDAIALLKNDKNRGFRIDIETDSTVQGDNEQQKQCTLEFAQAITGYIKEAAGIAIGAPEFTPALGHLMLSMIRKFRCGRDVEAKFEEAVEKVEIDTKAMANQPKPPSPEMIKANTEEMKAKAEIAAQQVEAASEKENATIDYQIKLLDLKIAQIKAAAEERDAGIKAGQAERENQFALDEHGRKIELAETQHYHKMTEAGGKPAIKPSHTQHVVDAIGQLTDHIKKLHDHMTAPVEFKRGPNGQLSGVRKGGIERTLHRDANGRGVILQ